MKIEKGISAGLATLLLLCLLPMPYGYYNLIRLLSAAVFSWLAYKSYERGNKNEIFISITLALLFQPFFKIALGRTIWNVVDIVVSLYLIHKLFKK